MRSKLLIAAATALAAVPAGCGGGTGAATHRAAVPGAGSHPTQIYRVQLAGSAQTPPGATHGVGAAIIAFHGDSRICWRFAHLHGFTGATSAHIQTEAAHRPGRVVLVLSRGPRLHHQGCVAISPALSRMIQARPSTYNVDIPSSQYPQGAVGAQL